MKLGKTKIKSIPPQKKNLYAATTPRGMLMITRKITTKAVVESPPIMCLIVSINQPIKTGSAGSEW